MSAPDEFDPMIERLFAQAAPLPDADAFARDIERRLERGLGLRTWALGAAGVVGGVIAVRETVASGLSLNLGSSGGRDGSESLVSGVEAAAGWLGGGWMSTDLSAVTGMQAFWLLTAGLIAAAAVSALRAVNEG